MTVFDPSDQSEEVSVIKTKIYNEPEYIPVFGDCEMASLEERKDCSDRNLLTYIYTNIKYPESARLAEQEGMVVTSIIIDKKGKIGSVELVKEKTTEFEALNQTALEVIETLVDFEPGTQDGKPVNVKMIIPIKFQLQ